MRSENPVRVTTATQTRAREAAVFAAGLDPFELMRAAGKGVATVILRRFPEVRSRGVLVFPGSGNNGGDAWIVATELARAGCPVGIDGYMQRYCEPRSAAAQRAKAEAIEAMGARPTAYDPVLCVDGILGIGVDGEAHGEAVQEIERVNECGSLGAKIVSIDVPSGLDATTGGGGSIVRADLTCSLGSVHRGLLLRRDESGEIVVIDLGQADVGFESAPQLVDADWVRRAVPPIPSDAHKGVRRRLAIVGGGDGMAGAPMLAARGAMRSGIGMVQLLVNPNNVPVVQAALPETMAARWPVTAEDQERVLGWAHVLLIGPGLGRTAMTRALVERLLVAWRGPVLLDADALNVFEGEPRTLGTLLGARPAIVTPHPVEAGRLLRIPVATVLERRFEVGAELAKTLGATVVLKGPPTIISSPDGRVAVSASGAPTLGMAGSGDVLSGIAATLLGQTHDPFGSGTSAAWIHGRAGERAAELGSVRGSSLGDVVNALRDVWALNDAPLEAPLLGALPAVGSQR